MPFDFKKTAEEKMRSVQPSHSTDKDRDSATSDIGWDSNDMLRNGSVSLNQIQEYKFWKKNISGYYKWMVVANDQLKKLDLTLKAMDSSESLGTNTAKNIGSIALRTAVNTGGSMAGGAIGAAIGTAIVPGIGTLAGMGIGMGVGALSGAGISFLGNMAVDKLDEKLEIVDPYPKTRNMIFEIDNYNKNFITKAIKKNIKKDNLKVTAGSSIVSGILGSVSPIKVPAYKVADLAVSHNRSLGMLENDKASHILNFTHDIREVLNESHSDAVTFMRKNYGDSEMSLTGFTSRALGSKLTLDTMVRTKNEMEIKINSINKQISKISLINRE
ncbi:hypothetical protein [Xenorhabdus bovienii]|uniref:hypothetical protein n=1 Tax=Xenorhabdus bovienii TaxID=40576 RepID=UPI0023B2E837|nr:hypothetical protein [Xenorhabdus bovienii]MDE9465884.1 hypothetical protein [Xenorhabdus bovienii]